MDAQVEEVELKAWGDQGNKSFRIDCQTEAIGTEKSAEDTL